MIQLLPGVLYVELTDKGRFAVERYHELKAAGVPEEKAMEDAMHDADIKFGRKASL